MLATLSSKHDTPSSLLCTLHQCQNILVFRQNTLLLKWQNFHFQAGCAIWNQSFSNTRATGELLTWRTMDDNMEGRGDQRGRGVRVRVRGGGRVRVRRRAVISDEIQATVVDHVVNHGLTMQEAGHTYRPLLSCIHHPDVQKRE